MKKATLPGSLFVVYFNFEFGYSQDFFLITEMLCSGYVLFLKPSACKYM